MLDHHLVVHERSVLATRAFVGQSASVVVVLQNQARVPIDLEIEPPEDLTLGVFFPRAPLCPSTIPVGAEHSIELEYRPRRPGNSRLVLRINGNGIPLSVEVLGSASLPPLGSVVFVSDAAAARAGSSVAGHYCIVASVGVNKDRIWVIPTGTKRGAAASKSLWPGQVSIPPHDTLVSNSPAVADCFYLCPIAPQLLHGVHGNIRSGSASDEIRRASTHAINNPCSFVGCSCRHCAGMFSRALGTVAEYLARWSSPKRHPIRPGTILAASERDRNGDELYLMVVSPSTVQSILFAMYDTNDVVLVVPVLADSKEVRKRGRKVWLEGINRWAIPSLAHANSLTSLSDTKLFACDEVLHEVVVELSRELGF